MTTVKNISKVLVLGALVVLPVFVFGATTPGQLVPDCGVNCGWNHLMQLAQNILNFFVYVAVPVSAVLFAWAGFLYLSARGNPGQITKAHSIFQNVAIGLIIVLVAWLIVYQVLDGLIDEDYEYEKILKQGQS